MQSYAAMPRDIYMSILIVLAKDPQGFDQVVEHCIPLLHNGPRHPVLVLIFALLVGVRPLGPL